MTSIKLTVNGVETSVEVSGTLTSGMVGLPISVSYDSTWDGLTKNLVFRSGMISKMLLDAGEQATVAHEVMIPGHNLLIGVEGISPDGNLVMPTTWADCGMIEFGANGGVDPTADPTLPVYAQLYREFEELKKVCNAIVSVTAEGDALILSTTLAVRTAEDAILIGGM